MRFVLALAVIALLPMRATAQAPQVDAISIIDFGVYSVVRVRTEEAAGTAYGRVGIMNDIKLVRHTDIICAQLGQSFGLEFQLAGAPGGKTVPLEWITAFPAPGVRSPKGQYFLKSKLSRDAVIGGRSFRFYTFDEIWEMVPGEWIFEFHYRGRKLGEKRFTVKTACEVS
ncbi:MAG: DUF3859 domain-containing protein [Hyphomicrobiaceae bacterium]